MSMEDNMPDKKEPMSLEQSFQQLDKIIEALESREISLEDSFRYYQEGMNLLKECNEKIDQVEKKILVLNGDGTLDEFQ